MHTCIRACVCARASAHMICSSSSKQNQRASNNNRQLLCRMFCKFTLNECCLLWNIWHTQITHSRSPLHHCLYTIFWHLLAYEFCTKTGWDWARCIYNNVRRVHSVICGEQEGVRERERDQRVCCACVSTRSRCASRYCCHFIYISLCRTYAQHEHFLEMRQPVACVTWLQIPMCVHIWVAFILELDIWEEKDIWRMH